MSRLMFLRCVVIILCFVLQSKAMAVEEDAADENDIESRAFGIDDDSEYRLAFENFVPPTACIAVVFGTKKFNFSHCNTHACTHPTMLPMLKRPMSYCYINKTIDESYYCMQPVVRFDCSLDLSDPLQPLRAHTVQVTIDGISKIIDCVYGQGPHIIDIGRNYLGSIRKFTAVCDLSEPSNSLIELFGCANGGEYIPELKRCKKAVPGTTTP